MEENNVPLHGLLASRVAESLRKRSRPSQLLQRQVCPHCEQSLSIKTFKKHKRLYYKDDGSWVRDSTSSSVLESGDPPALPTFENPVIEDNLQDMDVMEDSDVQSDDSISVEDEEEIWDESGPDSEFEGEECHNTAPQVPAFTDDSPEFHRASALMKWLVGFLLLLQAKYYIPDKAVDLLIKFLYILFSITGTFSPIMAVFAKCFPQSLFVMQRNIDWDWSFQRFVVCPKCNEICKFENCLSKVGSSMISKHCANVKYPNHPHAQRRKPCDAVLLKTVEFASGRKLLYPYSTYCYRSLQKSLQTLLLCQEFVKNCQVWQSQQAHDLLQDIYDGHIRKEFKQVQGIPFLALPFTFAFILNVDWFQPFAHTTASVGVIYLTVLNLPRFIRYKRENVILLGVIPGPHEPKLHINSFLKPLVIELQQFWEGVELRVHTDLGITDEIVRGALLCVACDIPAGRKVCGFLGHSANLGCTRCLKVFPGSVGNKDYSGFDRSNWPKRTNSQHREDVEKVRQCETHAKQQQMESLLGCRYSCLLELPYFDATRMLAIDPMHNLFLGTGKHMISLWLEHQLLTREKFESVQQFIDGITVPSDIGRIPQKIASGFAGFKADQYKTWILIYSIPALFHIFPSEHLECWRHFVLACRIICKQSLSETDIHLADALLLRFCKRVENLYGSSAITPNMHLHGHLKEVLLDYGPAQEFWLFPFERYNGILGKQPSNNRAIEPQVMKRFLRDNCASSFQFPKEFEEEFTSVSIDDRVVGSVRDTVTPNQFALPSRSTCSTLDLREIDVLKKLYCNIHPDRHHKCNSELSVHKIFFNYTKWEDVHFIW